MFKQIVLVALAIASVSANLEFTNCGKFAHFTISNYILSKSVRYS